jgi:hypothetical protein
VQEFSGFSLPVFGSGRQRTQIGILPSGTSTTGRPGVMSSLHTPPTENLKLTQFDVKISVTSTIINLYRDDTSDDNYYPDSIGVPETLIRRGTHPVLSVTRPSACEAG